MAQAERRPFQPSERAGNIAQTIGFLVGVASMVGLGYLLFLLIF